MRKTWFQNAIIYQIMIDRFSGKFTYGWDSPQFAGGTLEGITSKLDWLLDLGVTALLLSPFCATSDYHGYHIVDFRTVEPRFGGDQQFLRLVKECNKRNIRIIMDIVLNHCHETHKFFQEALKNPYSPYREWFIFSADGTYKAFLEHTCLPKFNLDNPSARSYMVDTVLFWLDRGVHGFRLDSATGLSYDFLRCLMKSAQERKSDCVFIAESALSQKDLLEYYDTLQIKNKLFRLWFGFEQDQIQMDYCDTLDSVLDFSFRDYMELFTRGKISEELLRNLLDKHFRKYPIEFNLALFLDSHDHDRLIANCYCNNDIVKKGREAIIAMMEKAIDIMVEYAKRFENPIIIYYGTEVLLPQVMPKVMGYPHADLVSRRSMDWELASKAEAQIFRNRIKYCFAKR